MIKLLCQRFLVLLEVPEQIRRILFVRYSQIHRILCKILDASDKTMNEFSSDTHAEKPKGISDEPLENIWKINLETAKGNIRTTTELNKQDVNSKLVSNFGTNDQMLQYRRI